MKNKLFLVLFALILVAPACDRDPYDLDLERFDVRWFDEDNSGTQTPADILRFGIHVNTTAADPDNQYITEWEFSYSVNGTFGNVLDGDAGISSNSITFNADIAVKNLWLPFSGGLLPGDVVAFHLWVKDNYGTQVEQEYRYVLE